MPDRIARLKKDAKASAEFLQQNADLIESYLEHAKSQEYIRIPIRNKLAQLARDQFGYAPSTAASDITYRIVKAYRKAS